MSNPSITTPTQDERITAALAHLGILLPVTGILAPILVWLTQKDKSRFVAFQSLQALAYHLVLVLGGFLGFACYMLSFFSLFATAPMMDRTGSGEFAFVFLPFIIFGLIFLFGFLMVVYGIAGAVMVFQGKDFRYVGVGDFIARNFQA